MKGSDLNNLLLLLKYPNLATLIACLFIYTFLPLSLFEEVYRVIISLLDCFSRFFSRKIAYVLFGKDF